MFNLAVREELAEKNPGWKVRMLPENNARDRILSTEELDLLLQHLPRHALSYSPTGLGCGLGRF
jgi:hypothetical protein